MKRKLFTLISLTTLISMFVLAASISAAELDILNLNVTTDGNVYDYDDEITTTIKIENSSELLEAAHVAVHAELPKELTLIDEENYTFDNGKIYWDFNSIEALGSEVLSFKTKLLEPESPPAEEPKG